MNNKGTYIYAIAMLAAASSLMQSCSMEQPFGDADGVLRMNVRVDSDVTRAQLNDDELADKCIVYISSEKGLVRKYVGLSSLPSQEVLKEGRYVAEAWTGDSVPASFESRFFRGYQPFTINGGKNSDVTLTCKIANSVVTVNSATIDTTLMRDFEIKVASSTGELIFDEENYTDAKGYFMMPYDEAGVRESKLNVTITGVNAEGAPFTKKHVIEGVKPAYEYEINISFNPNDPEEEGGGFFTITVVEKENLIRDTIAIFAAPAIQGSGFDIDKQQYAEPGEFTKDFVVNVIAFNEINSFLMTCKDPQNLHLPSTSIDIKQTTTQQKSELNAVGIYWDKDITEVEGYDGVTRQSSNITFSKEYLNSLPARDTEYVVTLVVTDGFGKVRTKDLRIAVGENARIEEDPVIVNDAVDPTNFMAIGARKVTLTASVVDESATNVGIRYRESGTTEWTTKSVGSATRGGTAVSVTLTGLKPGTRYEYQAVADGFNSDSKYFTTEAVYQMPNAGMEEWGTYSAKTLLGTKNVIIPSTSGNKDTSFWGSGNEGSATASKVVLDKSGDMKHGGSYSARLASTSAMGIIAAGNMFVGSYVKTDGTNGVLSLGRQYNGSHPTKLRVYANYRPGGGVSIKSGNEKYVDIQADGTDHGQIYIALTTAPIEIRTNPDNRKLFPAAATNEDGNPSEDYDKVVAYGQVTWDSAFGPDNGLAAIDIPFVYTSRAKTQKPLYLVVVASASKFGDFFCGSSSSVMYLDDFELIYE
ncbi:MAG: DUF4493 domain-containing protein [Muribaculaceae bacterium]|nr:DUF4493 domain-containing protein [Muribaculaceae bacterium]